MDLMQEEQEKLCGLAKALMVPAVVVNVQYALCFRNRMAQRLLPPPWKLKRYLTILGKELGTAGMTQVKWGDTVYFAETVNVSGCSTHFLLLFTETFLPFQEPFSRYLIRENLSCFRQFGTSSEQRSAASGSDALADRIASRLYGQRQHYYAYYRLLTVNQTVEKAPVSFDSVHLLKKISDSLKGARIGFRVNAEKDLRVFATPSSFLFSVLSVVQFLKVFEGQDDVSVTAKEKGGWVELTFSFFDREGLFGAFSSLMEWEEDRFPETMGMIPLLFAMSVAKKEGMKFRVTVRENLGEVVVKIPLSKEPSALFLGSRRELETVLVEETVRKIFYPEGE